MENALVDVDVCRKLVAISSIHAVPALVHVQDQSLPESCQESPQDNTFCNFQLSGPNNCKVVNLPRFPRLASFEQVLRFLNKSGMCSCVRVCALYDHDRFPLDVSCVRDPAGFLDYSSIEELSWLADRL